MAPNSFLDEILRKGFHLMSVAIVLVYAFFGKEIVLQFMTLYLVSILVVEHLRIDLGYKVPFVNYLFRKKEEKAVGGYVYFTLGSIVAVSVFSENVAYAAILMTTFGDMIAALVGKRFGNLRIFRGGKSLEGSLAEFFVDLIIAYAFLSNITIALVMAFAATFVETNFEKIDDNLAIPVFSGFAAELFLILSVYVHF